MPILNPLPLLLPLLAAPNAAVLPDRTPSLVISWTAPLDAEKVTVRNPFAPDRLSTIPVLKKREFDSSAKGSAPVFVGVDLDAKGGIVRIRKILMPYCENADGSCQPEDPMEATARELMRWTWSPGTTGSRSVGTRAILEFNSKWEADKIFLTKIDFHSIGPAELPPPVRNPLPGIDQLVADRKEEGWTDDLDLGQVSPESLDVLPIPKRRSIDVPLRTASVAADLLVHLAPTGKVDRILPISVRPAVLWPYFQKTVTSWTFEPGKAESGPVPVWTRITATGNARIEGEMDEFTKHKKNIPVRPPK